jgi:hypothetical protein
VLSISFSLSMLGKARAPYPKGCCWGKRQSSQSLGTGLYSKSEMVNLRCLFRNVYDLAMSNGSRFITVIKTERRRLGCSWAPGSVGCMEQDGGGAL